MTGAATRAVRNDIARKPANSAEKASARPRANGRARQIQASAADSAASSAGSQMTGSRSAARLSATPPIAATGSQRKNRRSSASRASAAANAARQSGAHAETRVSPAAADRTPACERDVMPFSQPYVGCGRKVLGRGFNARAAGVRGGPNCGHARLAGHEGQCKTIQRGDDRWRRPQIGAAPSPGVRLHGSAQGGRPWIGWAARVGSTCSNPKEVGDGRHFEGSGRIESQLGRRGVGSRRGEPRH